MTELKPPESHINGGGPLAVGSTDNVVATTKRQRRPSVRLGDIGGDQPPYESNPNRRPKQQWKLPIKDSTNKSSKTRPLLNLSNATTDYLEVQDNGKNNNLDSVAIGSWKLSNSSKSKRGPTAKRVRSNWASSKTDEDDKFSGGDDDDADVGFRDFDRDGSDSGLKGQSPIQSLDGDRGHGNFIGHRRDVRVRVSDGAELDGPSDTDARNWNNSERNGVRVWLNQLGLGRYAPVFEVHEVDDEVLPLLTLEDLKDMGINAVGSRRKMYCSIQKLGKGFS